jgi:hypothetical protein
MIKNDRPFSLISRVRGMKPILRSGSLICDPYVTFSPDERNELIAFYYRIMQPNYSLDHFTDFFWKCSTAADAALAVWFRASKKTKRIS